MDLPDATAVTAASTFIELAWNANPLLLIVLAIVAIWKVGPYVLRKVSRALPG